MTSIPLEQAFRIFLQDKEISGVEKVTLQDYRGCFEYFKKKMPQCINTNDISKAVMNEFISQIKETGIRIPSINHHIVHMRVFFYWCMAEEYCDRFSIKTLKGQEERIKSYTDEEVNRLIRKPVQSASFVEWRTYTIICFILATGARMGTITNIKLSDIDFNAREVVYAHLKNKSIANIPLSQTLCKTLKEYLKMWNTNSEYLFSDIGGNKLTVNAAGFSMRKYCKKREVPHKGNHALRHTFARMYIKNGGNAFVLQRMLCHTTLDMTKKYVALFTQDLQQSFIADCPLDKIRNSKSRARIVQRIK